MPVLSERLKIIAEQIEHGETMADVGTDHGFLPLYLWKNGVCPKIIMADISAGSLKKAKEAFHGHTQTGIDFREGDGLKPIEKNEVDVVVIAGMGGVLMTRILGEDVSKTISFGKYILQPRNGAGKLRFWLDKAGFDIFSEHLAPEGKFICEILEATPPRKISTIPSLHEYPDDVKYEIPRNLTNESKKIFTEYIIKKLDTESEILKSMICGKASIVKISRVENRIKFFEGVLEDVY